MGGEARGAQRGGGNLDHRADLEPIEIRSLLPGHLLEDLARLNQLAGGRHQGKHDRQAAPVLAGQFGPSPQEGAELRPEEVGATKGQPDASEPQGRVLLRIALHERQRLVGADVEGAEDDPVHREGPQHLGVEPHLLLHRRRYCPAQEQEFGPNQAASLPSGLDRRRQVLDRRDVRGQLDPMPVRGPARLVPQRHQRLAAPLLGIHPPPQRLSLRGVGADDDRAGPALHRHLIASSPDRVEQPRTRNHGRDAQSAGKDRRVARGRPRLGHDRGDHLHRDGGRLRRGELVGHDHRANRGRFPGRASAQEDLHHAVPHVVEIGHSPREVLALRGGKQVSEHPERLDHGSFRGGPSPDRLIGHPLQLGIGGELGLGLEDPGLGLAGGHFDRPGDLPELLLGPFQGCPQASRLLLGRPGPFLRQVVLDRRLRRDHERRGKGGARRRRPPREPGAHP